MHAAKPPSAVQLPSFLCLFPASPPSHGIFSSRPKYESLFHSSASPTKSMLARSIIVQLFFFLPSHSNSRQVVTQFEAVPKQNTLNPLLFCRSLCFSLSPSPSLCSSGNSSGKSKVHRESDRKNKLRAYGSDPSNACLILLRLYLPTYVIHSFQLLILLDCPGSFSF